MAAATHRAGAPPVRQHHDHRRRGCSAGGRPCRTRRSGDHRPAGHSGSAPAPWSDSVAGLERLAQQFPVLGLSNAGRTALLRLNAYAGLRRHQALSSEAVLASKPAPEVYQLAIDTAGCPPDRVLMVAAHAWDLRGAQARGTRTAYVQRPVGDPPTSSVDFDGQFNGLNELVTALTAR